MYSATFRRLPVVAWVFLALYLATLAYNLTHEPKLWHNHLGLAISVLILSLLLNAAIIVWRQPWAWWLDVIGSAATVVTGPFTLHDQRAVVQYVLNLALLGLLLSSQMRRYVGVRWPRHAPRSA